MRNSFVGREPEISELEKRLDEVRLLTLVGAPGIGKTRLGLEVSARLADQYADGVGVVELAPIADPALTARAVAAALEVPDGPQRSAEDALAERLANRELLLVLDNCEHLADAVAPLVGRLLSACPALKVLATSRAALGLSGEQVWPVPPLDGPPAVQLFHDRAGEGTGPSPPTGHTGHTGQADVVERICRQLDGLPLAIELASALTRVLSPGEILDRLDQALPLLRRRSPDANPRQQTMEATVDWSYRLLDDDERRLFDRLSVFAGGFDLDAAQAIVGDGDVLDRLATLVDHSLVLVGGSGAGGTRYRLLEPLRQYAAARFAGRPEREAIRRRHAQHYLGVAHRLDDEVGTERIRAALLRFGEDEGNFRAALDFARSQPGDLGLRLCTALARTWAVSRRVHEGRAWFDEMLTIPTPDRRLRASALSRASRLTGLQQDHAVSQQLLEESLAIERELGDELRVARRIRSLATVHTSEGDHDQAQRLLEESISICRARDDQGGLALALAFLALDLQLAGKERQAEPYLEEALALSQATGNVVATLHSMSAAGFGAILAGDTVKLRQYTEVAALLHQSGGLDDDTTWLWGAIVLATAEGRYRSALRLAGAEEAVAQRNGVRFQEQFRRRLRPWLERARARVPPIERARLQAAGARMTTGELIDEALAPPDGGDGSPLSRREAEIADLVAQGLGNVEIAERLVISKRTVESHVAHIKTKLGLARRVEIATWALRRATRPDAPDQERTPRSGRSAPRRP